MLTGPTSWAGRWCCRNSAATATGSAATASAKRSSAIRSSSPPLLLETALDELYSSQIRPAKEQGLSAAVYTQLSDVEDELNGLLTYDRKMVKMPIQTVRKIVKVE
jgi:hypothetical protein